MPWSDSVLKTLFWLGLDDSLVGQVPTAANSYSLAQYIDFVMLQCGSSLTVGEVDEPAITTLSLTTPLASVHESVSASTPVRKSSPAFSPEYAHETLLPMTSAKGKKQSGNKHSISAPVCPLESVPECSPTPVPEASNQSVPVPEPSNEVAPASVSHLDSLAKMAVTPEVLAKMATTPEARSTMAALPEPMSKMEPRRRQTRLMSSVADPPLRSM